MRVLVTGGSGYVGSNIANHLIITGHDVVIIDDLSSGVRLNNPDIECRLSHLLEGCNWPYDVVVHAAARADVRNNWTTYGDVFEENVNETRALLDICKGTPVIFLSTAAVYGRSKAGTPPFTEDVACHPESPYAASKLACEGLLSAYSVRYNVSHTTLRLPSVVGGLGYHHGCIVDFARQAAIGPINALTNGHAARPMVHVADVARAVDWFIRAKGLPFGNRGHTYNLLGGYMSCREIVAIMAQRKSVVAKWADSESAWPGDHPLRIDAGVLQNKGFHYTHGIGAGVRQTLEGLAW